MSLVYIAGYAQRKYDAAFRDGDEATYYYSEFGGHIDKLNRGGLCKPVDVVVQWAFLCYSFFLSLDSMSSCCLISAFSYFMQIARAHSLGIYKRQARILANTLINNLCKK